MNKKHLKNVGPTPHCHSPGVATVARRLRIETTFVYLLLASQIRLRLTTVRVYTNCIFTYLLTLPIS